MSGVILVTGARGFVGRHLLRELGDAAIATEVDVLDARALTRAVAETLPDAVIHLAARASVAASWHASADVWSVNVVGTVNVLEAVRNERPQARVLFVSTADVYGRAEEVPALETSPVAPLSPYAASKAAAEIACARARLADGLAVTVTRSFTHIGPGQDERFAIGSWVRQIARLEREGGGSVRVGNLAVRRDLVDVRDACRAYRLLLDPAIAPDVYNIASGDAVTLDAVLQLLTSMSRCPISIETDAARVRPADVPVLSGDASRLRRATGWRPEISLEQTLADALEDARRAVASEETVQA